MAIPDRNKVRIRLRGYDHRVKPKVTIKDVATTAGVSIYKTTQVLKGKATESTTESDTRKRILQAAQALGYRPHSTLEQPINSFATKGEVALVDVFEPPLAAGIYQTQMHQKTAGMPYKTLASGPTDLDVVYLNMALDELNSALNTLETEIEELRKAIAH